MSLSEALADVSIGVDMPVPTRRAAVQRFLLGCLVCLSILLLNNYPLIATDLPDLNPHPLPPSLDHLPNPSLGPGNNYFDRLQSTPVGALIWSRFPVSVGLDLTTSSQPRAEAWTTAVEQAIADWQPYIAMRIVSLDQKPDITIRRRAVPIERASDGKLRPIRFAQTQFEFYTEDNILRHRMVIHLSPNQADRSLLSGARHELGHALGLWVHSDQPTDVMYDRQVNQPPEISARDIATLKMIYAQPTRLGWPLSKNP